MLDSCSNNKEKQVIWIEKETQVTGVMPDQNCFDQNIIAPNACLVWWPGPKHLCQISACAAHTSWTPTSIPPFPLVSQFPSLSCSNSMKMPSSAGHRRHTAVPVGLTQSWLINPGKSRAWGPSAAQNQPPNLQVTFSIASRQWSLRIRARSQMLEHLGGEPSKSGSDAVRAHGEFGQCPQQRVGLLASLALLYRARSQTYGSLPAQEIPRF